MHVSLSVEVHTCNHNHSGAWAGVECSLGDIGSSERMWMGSLVNSHLKVEVSREDRASGVALD